MADTRQPPAIRLAYPHKFPPLAVLAVAQIAGIELDAQPDPKLASGSQPVLHLSDGYAPVFDIRSERFKLPRSFKSIGHPLHAVYVRLSSLR